MKNIVVLGCTGSIGHQALEVISAYPEKFNIVGIAARRDSRRLAEFIKKFRPSVAALADPKRMTDLKDRLGPTTCALASGPEAIESMAALPEADLVINAMVGAVGLRSTVAALKADKTVALANKESLVAGGELVSSLVKREHQLLPVDSEHSAIFQCIQGEDVESIERLIVTGSGGPFRGRSHSELKMVTTKDALRHPTWSMGAKITIDSATLMNKGLEVIEAHYLFGIKYDQLEVLIHPQSIVHSLVEFKDGSVKAQMGYPDMKLPIQYALTYPERWHLGGDRLDLSDLASLTFEEPDMGTFSCLKLALDAANHGRTYPIILNAANEVAVAAFLDERITFNDIPDVIESALHAHEAAIPDSLEVIQHADKEGRHLAESWIGRHTA